MIEYVFLTNKGQREKNEDAYGNVSDEFFVIADGLGGRPAGEVASKIAVESAISVYKASEKENPQVLLKNIFRKANEEILYQANSQSEWLGMGTTVLCSLIKLNEIILANLGDCRAYIFSEGKLSLKTKDDRDDWGTLLEALGMEEDINPRLSKVGVKKDDIILLCSDGLFDFVKDKPIEKILESNASLEDKARGLIDVALQFGSTDNITVGLIKI